MDISFDVPATVKEGDYFEVKLSDSLNGYGATSKDVVYDPYLYVGNDVVAKGIYDPISNTFKYVFTKEAEKYGKFHQDINEVLYIDPKRVPNSTPDVDIFAKLGSHNIANKVNVDYSLELKEGDANIDSNGVGKINELDSKNGHYEETYYVNYAGKTQHGTELTFKNDDKAEAYGKITESKAVFDQEVLDSVKVYRVKDPNKLNSSFDVDASDANLEELATSEYTKEIIPIEDGLKIKFKNEGSTDTYVVKYKGKYDSKKFVQIKSKVIADPTKPYVTATHSSNVSLTSAKSAPKADIGKFMEFHVYQTLNEDGTVKTTDYASDPENFSSGNTQQTYTTEKKDRPGYEIYKVDMPDGAVADEFGNKITSNFRAGKKDVVTYYYRKIQPNHTVWIDEEGNDVKNVENGLKEKGDTPAGYTFVESKENEKQKDGSTKNTHIYHKIITNWVEENTGKVLKTKEDGAKPDTEGDDIKDYHKVKDLTDQKTGDVTNIYHKIITKWIEENTNKVLRGPEDGSKPDDDNIWDIPEYKLVRTETNPDNGDVTNIYKKIDVNYTAWVDDEGNRIKQPEKDLKERGDDPEGYKFTKTTEIDENGTKTRIHHYHKIVTNWIEDKTEKPLQDSQEGAKPDTDGNDIAEYKYLRTKVDNKTGDVTNIYHKIVTNWKEDHKGTVLRTQEVGEKPDTDGNDIENYKWIRTDTDPDTGDITNYYHKIKTYWVEMEKNNTLKDPEDGAHPDDDGVWDIPDYGLVRTTVNPDTGDVTNIYKKIVPPFTVWVDEDGKQIKNPEDGLKEKGKDPEGYKFVKSKEKEQLPDGGWKNTHTYHKIVTNWVEDGKNDPLKPQEDGAHPDNEGDDIKDYYLVMTKEDKKTGDVLNVYRQRTTSYVDEGGDEIEGNPTENGVKEKKTIKDYEFVKTRTDKNGNVTHVYKKVVKPKTVWEDEDGNPVKDPKEGTEEKGKDPEGYTYLRTKDGDKLRRHVYHKIVTKWLEEKTGEVLKTKEAGQHPDDNGDDIKDYVFVTTIVDKETGDVTNVYKKIVPKTSYVDENGKEIPNNPSEEGEKEKKEIPGYTFVKTEKDPKTGETKHIYKKITPKTSYVDENGKEIPNNPSEEGEKEKKEIPGYTFVKTEKDPKTGETKHIYKKKEETPPTPTPSIPSIPDQPSKPIENNTTIWVDENGNPLKDSKNGSVEKGKDPEGYEFVGTVKTKDGDTAHVYKKIAKEAGKVEEKETPKEKESPKEAPKAEANKKANKAEASADKKANKAEASANKNANPNVKTGVEALVSPILGLISAGAGLSLLKSKKKDEE